MVEEGDILTKVLHASVFICSSGVVHISTFILTFVKFIPMSSTAFFKSCSTSLRRQKGFDCFFDNHQFIKCGTVESSRREIHILLWAVFRYNTKQNWELCQGYILCGKVSADWVSCLGILSTNLTLFSIKPKKETANSSFIKIFEQVQRTSVHLYKIPNNSPNAVLQFIEHGLYGGTSCTSTSAFCSGFTALVLIVNMVDVCYGTNN